MKKEIKTTEAIFPMPVLMISTFNEDGSKPPEANAPCRSPGMGVDD